jgi:hypothetical protein
MSGTFNAFNLLWGSVDADNPANHNLLTFTFLGAGNVVETITGDDIIAAAGGASPVVPGTSNIAVFLSALPNFDMIRVTATDEAFEFAIGVAGARARLARPARHGPARPRRGRPPPLSRPAHRDISTGRPSGRPVFVAACLGFATDPRHNLRWRDWRGAPPGPRSVQDP